jgi:hypothetical protein
MAQSEIRSFQRVEERKKKFIVEEQGRLLLALDAMCFLTQPPPGKQTPNVPITVSHMKSGPPKRRAPKKPIRVSVREI